MPQLPRKLDIEVYQGRIVAVWLGCLRLPFEVTEVDTSRAKDLGIEAFLAEDEGYHAITECHKRLLSPIPGTKPVDINEDEISFREI